LLKDHKSKIQPPTRPGLEPGIGGPKPPVLPITPPGNPSRIYDLRFLIDDLKAEQPKVVPRRERCQIINHQL
jgi:hypothetical protein